MINYFSLLIPICIFYMAKFYTLKHDYEHVGKEYAGLSKEYYRLLIKYNRLIEKEKDEQSTEEI